MIAEVLFTAYSITGIAVGITSTRKYHEGLGTPDDRTNLVKCCDGTMAMMVGLLTGTAWPLILPILGAGYLVDKVME